MYWYIMVSYNIYIVWFPFWTICLTYMLTLNNPLLKDRIQLYNNTISGHTVQNYKSYIKHLINPLSYKIPNEEEPAYYLENLAILSPPSFPFLFLLLSSLWWQGIVPYICGTRDHSHSVHVMLYWTIWVSKIKWSTSHMLGRLCPTKSHCLTFQPHCLIFPVLSSSSSHKFIQCLDFGQIYSHKILELVQCKIFRV